MSYKIGLVHATINAVVPINDAFRRYASDAKVLNFLDDGLIEEVNQQGKVTPKAFKRFMDLLVKAEESGVDGILASCTVFTPYVPQISNLFDIPILSVDYNMLSQAVEKGERIGLIATVETAGTTSETILSDIAKIRKKEIIVNKAVITEAFEALQRGDLKRHDELIHHKINELSDHCDVIVLAQLSMARAVNNGLPNHQRPILTSPETSVKSIIEKLSQER